MVPSTSFRAARCRAFSAFTLLAGWSLVAGVGVAEDRTYDTEAEAYKAGLAHLALKEVAKSQGPLEQALKMAKDDTARLKVYRALLPSYRLLPAIDKTLEAQEFIITKSTSAPEKSLTRSSLVSFAYERGKLEPVIQRYEKRLAEDPDDRTSLYILSEIYDRASPNPKRGVQVGRRLADLIEKEGMPVDARDQAQLAGQTIKAGDVKRGAELYEQLAKRETKQKAWYWKEAAVAWLKAGDKEKALAAARASEASPPEDRGGLLEHFLHRSLGDVFLQTGEPKLAIPHYEKALEKTDIEGYKTDVGKSLAEAREKAK